VASERRDIERLEEDLQMKIAQGGKRPKLYGDDSEGETEVADEAIYGATEGACGTVMMNGASRSQKESSEANAGDDEFFDAAEGGEYEDLSPPEINNKLFSRLLGDDRGRRCPLRGSALNSTGEQVFSPYLQRPLPLTDDVIAERRLMVDQQKHTATKPAALIARRLEVARRFQEPKLLSDMQAFKAANPKAVFQDFVSWYGNPVNPLEDLLDDGTESDTTMTFDARLRLDKAAEAIKALKDTRELWTDTWNKAEPVPAFKQEPLFDAASTVELALDYLETLHPATLLCQIMAVNLSSAYFVLTSSAGNAANLAIVRQSLSSLREKVENALAHASRDVLTAVTAKSASINNAASVPSTVASVETIASCERACAAVGETETILARAISLLHKLDGNYELVESVLRRLEGETVNIRSNESKRPILALVAKHQGSNSIATALPGLREYLFRAVDSPIPCQLCVRYDDKIGNGTSNRSNGTNEAGMLVIALTKVTRE